MQGFVVRLPSTGLQKRQLTKKTIVPPAKCRKVADTNRSSVQMYLDLGQKSLGKSTTCKVCEMVYVTDDPDDTENHRTFCRQVSQEIRIRPTAGVYEIEKFEDVKQHILQASWRKAATVKAVSAAVYQAMKELGSSNDMMTDEDTAYFLLNSRHVVMGCMVCEQDIDMVRCAYISESSSATVIEVGSRAHAKDKESCKDMQQTDTVLCCAAEDGKIPELKDNTCIGAILGVKLMWTSAQHRRQRVALRLLDAARRSMVYGTVVPVESIAFSQPTDDGLAFARAYCKTKRILAYA